MRCIRMYRPDYIKILLKKYLNRNESIYLKYFSIIYNMSNHTFLNNLKSIINIQKEHLNTLKVW